MPAVTILLALLIPLLGIGGGIYAWRQSKHAEDRQANLWRDDSLDDWRLERDAEIERARLERNEAARSEEGGLHGGAERETSQTEHQQRLGG